MYYRTLLVIVIVVFSGCGDENGFYRLDPNKDRLIFGTFYGYCVGERCVEIFALQDGKLYEDRSDTYVRPETSTDFQFEKLPDDKFELVRDMFETIPHELSLTQSTTFGCPDCADGGGVYIEISTGSETKIFFIDNFKVNIPEYLHPLVDSVRQKVDLLK